MKQAILSFGTALILSTVFTALLIPFLKRKHIGQNIREVGPKHQKKAGTPTMGGMAFVPAIVLAVLPFIGKNPDMIPVLVMTVGYGLIGMLDDGLKKKHGVNLGLKAWQKFALQMILTAAFCWYRMSSTPDASSIRIPFMKGQADIGWWYVPLLFLVVLGADNGVNLTDGIDGLCSSVTAVVALFFTALSFFRSLPVRKRDRTGDGCGLRCASRLPAFQYEPGTHFHGRYRIAGPRRLRSLDGADPASAFHASHLRHHLRLRDPVGDDPGELFQTQPRKTRLQDDADPSYFRIL